VLNVNVNVTAKLGSDVRQQKGSATLIFFPCVKLRKPPEQVSQNSPYRKIIMDSFPHSIEASFLAVCRLE
jgi:hypothetical protein